MQTGYLKRSWGAITAEKGWIKPILLLALLQFVPIFGQIALYGYYYEWARDAAWGVEKPLPRKLPNMGNTLKIGLYAWGVIMIWTCVFSFALSFISLIPFLGTLIGFVGFFVLLAISMMAMVAAMRAVIYNSFEPVVQIKQVWAMSKKDIGGLARIFCIGLLLVPVVLIVCIIIFAIVFFVILGAGGITAGINEQALIPLLLGLLPLLMIVLFALFFLMLIAQVIVSGLQIRALGYWTAQFDPSRWKGQNDPLPFEVDQVATATYYAPTPPVNQESTTQATSDQAVSEQPTQVEPVQGQTIPDAASSADVAAETESADHETPAQGDNDTAEKH